jgi:hypothetical protein
MQTKVKRIFVFEVISGNSDEYWPSLLVIIKSLYDFTLLLFDIWHMPLFCYMIASLQQCSLHSCMNGYLAPPHHSTGAQIFYE